MSPRHTSDANTDRQTARVHTHNKPESKFSKIIVVLKRVGANHAMQKCSWPQPYRPPGKLGLQATSLPDLEEEKSWRLSSALWQMIQ